MSELTSTIPWFVQAIKTFICITWVAHYSINKLISLVEDNGLESPFRCSNNGHNFHLPLIEHRNVREKVEPYFLSIVFLHAILSKKKKNKN